MGQFLATGLALSLSISKKEMAKNKLELNTMIQSMESVLNFNAALYTPQERAENLVFELKPEILHRELIPFLDKFYPLLYRQNKYTDFQAVLEKLKSTPPEKWLELADMKKYEAFQVDIYGEPAYLSQPFDRRIAVYYDSILLAGEGKIEMETYGQQFSFFAYCIAKTFPEFALASAVRVYITG